jgi:hypothetical protein
MRSSWIFPLYLVFLISLVALPAHSQLQSSSSAPALRMGRYDKSTEVVVSGTIASIQTQAGSLPHGTYLSLNSGALAVNVQMGLFSKASIPFSAGNQVQVTGSMITFNGQQILLARQVQSSNQTLVIRTANGFVVRPRPTAQNGGIQP